MSSPISTLPEDTTVLSLFDEDSKEWNIPLIETLFSLAEVEKIKAIPLCLSSQSDLLCWSLSTNAIYTIKTGYGMLCTKPIKDLASIMSSGPPKQFWSKIWKLKVPNKIKSFLWRACTDSLPTKCNLIKRKVLLEPTCSLCLKEPEFIPYALWDCEKIKPVWKKDFTTCKTSVTQFPPLLIWCIQ